MNKSFWLETTRHDNYPILDSNISTDVCIVGTGITGVVTAYLLQKAGLKVVLLDRQEVCSGVTANTSAKITSQHGLFYTYLINSYGQNFAKLYLEANERAIQLVRNIVEQEHISCDLEREDHYVYTFDSADVPIFKKETENVQSLGFPAEFVENLPIPLPIKGAVKFPNQAQFHSRKYVLSLLDIIKKQGGNIFENSKVIDIKHEKEEYITYTDSCHVTSRFVVLATHYPIINFPGFHFVKMYQSKSYAIALDTQSELFPGMYISNKEPIVSLKTILDNDNRLLLVVGGDHKTGATDMDLDKKYEDLFSFAKQYYPQATIKYQWTTEDCISLDKIPYIGKFSNLMPNVYIATGFNKWGISSSHVAANIIADCILGQKNVYEDIFTSTRLKPITNRQEFGNMMKESIYSLGINRLSPPNFSFDDIQNGCGGVVDYHGEKLGIYKDENGKVFAVIPFCKHLGCELSWNNVDKTWDCPCHGSRYTHTGKLITEPSKYNLDIVNLE